jgi:hemoglobin
MKKDIEDNKDIEQLVNHFYEKVKKDETIGRYFTEVVAVNWEKHLPVMYKFWENALFYTGNYNGNPMKQHLNLHAKNPFTADDFKHWIGHFNTSVDELFEGKNAELIKLRALNIATVMQTKMFK